LLAHGAKKKTGLGARISRFMGRVLGKSMMVTFMNGMWDTVEEEFTWTIRQID
jgi:hypothetical protein